MTNTRFDAWTRRRVTLAMGGLVATTLGLSVTEESAAKHNHRRQGAKKCASGKKRCSKPRCVTGTCCPSKVCGQGCSCYLVAPRETACLHAINVDCEWPESTCTSDADCDDGSRCARIECALSNPRQCSPICDATSM